MKGFNEVMRIIFSMIKIHGAPATIINKIVNKNYKLIVLMQADVTKIFRSLEDIEKNGGKFVHSSLRTIMGK